MSNRWMQLAVGLAFAQAGCKLNSTVDKVQAETSCTEFSSGSSFDSVKVTSTVRAYMTAGATYRDLNTSLSASVKTACANIAIDLGGVDTWSALGDTDDAIANAQLTGACDVANLQIATVMDASLAANFAVTETPGACHPDFAAQVACEAQCKKDATCDSGTVVTRCDPAQLTVVCDAECNAEASCEGKSNGGCNCMGKCEATCTGSCQGTCTAADGKRTDNDPNCHGKCSSSCHGMCTGECKMEVAANCGASVSCKGGCTSTYTAASCDSEFTPPTCTVDPDCEASCTATVAANAVCDPPQIQLYLDTTINAAAALKLKTTLDANLSALLGARVQGTMVSQSAPKLVVTGSNLLQILDTADVKSVSCATITKKSSEKVSASLSVSLAASASVLATCQSRSM